MGRFNHMTKAEVCAAAQKGGRAAHAMGVAHVWNSETARAAARIAVERRRARKAVSTLPCPPPEGMAVHDVTEDDQ